MGIVELLKGKALENSSLSSHSGIIVESSTDKRRPRAKIKNQETKVGRWNGNWWKDCHVAST